MKRPNKNTLLCIGMALGCAIGISILFFIVSIMIISWSGEEWEVLYEETPLVAVSDSYVVMISGGLFSVRSSYTSYVIYAIPTEYGVKIENERIYSFTHFIEQDDIKPCKRIYVHKKKGFFGVEHSMGISRIEYVVPLGTIGTAFDIDLK